MLRPLLCCALLLLAACSRPQPPEKERPVEPRAAQSDAALTQAIQAPLDKAKGVQDTLDKAAEQELAEFDRQTQ
jgi:hypothetical protein